MVLFSFANTIYARTSFLAANNYMYAQNKQIHVRTKQTKTCTHKTNKYMYAQNKQIHVRTKQTNICTHKTNKYMYAQNKHIHVLFPIVPKLVALTAVTSARIVGQQAEQVPGRIIRDNHEPKQILPEYLWRLRPPLLTCSASIQCPGDQCCRNSNGNLVNGEGQENSFGGFDGLNTGKIRFQHSIS